MIPRIVLALLLTAAALLACTADGPACCPAYPSGKPVVNADQTVIIIWDAEKKVEHFIRKASFKGEADNFGFLVPTPTQPELEESGNDAFPYLLKVTEPEHKTVVIPPPPRDVKAMADKPVDKKDMVKVLFTKDVAGFNAVVLEASSATALTDWLKENGYAFSPQIEAWAKPYVDQGWKLTALKIAKDKDGKNLPNLTAAALRITFKTDRPLFPYREPDSQSPAEALGARGRLLRIYFVGDARYDGELTKDTPWTGKVAWAGKLSDAARTTALDHLKLPKDTGPAQWHLTEFEDPWPYRVAPADLYFSRAQDQKDVRREPIIHYVYGNGTSEPSPTTSAPTTSSPSASGDWLPWACGGGAGLVIVALALVLLRRRAA